MKKGTPTYVSILFFSGVLLANGKTWKEQRSFVHSVFRSLGVGKKSYEYTISTEMEQLIAAIEENEGVPFKPVILVGQAISNIICTVVFGRQYKYSDAEFQRVHGHDDIQ